MNAEKVARDCLIVFSQVECERILQALQEAEQRGHRNGMKDAVTLYSKGWIERGLLRAISMFEKRLPFSMRRTCDCSADAVSILEKIRQEVEGKK